jgi:hypothetical protein
VTIQNAYFSGRKNDLGKALIVGNGCSGEYAPAFMQRPSQSQ